MIPRIEILSKKKLIGKRIKTSLTDNKTHELWRSFMPKRAEIINPISSDLFAVQVYEPNYFEAFNPNTVFEKWATLEVTDFDNMPAEMESFLLSGGLYAVFELKGHDIAIFDYIFRTWIPNSKYDLDHRPHFEILGAKYKKDDPNSEEEIWVPIKEKNSLK
ncbi:GyrI-like domain-containing protein [Flavobacterium aquariorum]|uniref:GyrI-like domain-containing protein n=1 Tax=Flavobacterium aquariorum TaxID=2217670 RepID=A0A2W7TZG8_9FLAO|nr:GyrI-like domain-containing protein [Flavobacterium aquariorum]PZX94766.1 GyrI-like domain-containing protein [Flavobacterium aquariorum]